MVDTMNMKYLLYLVIRYSFIRSGSMPNGFNTIVSELKPKFSF